MRDEVTDKIASHDRSFCFIEFYRSVETRAFSSIYALIDIDIDSRKKEICLDRDKRSRRELDARQISIYILYYLCIITRSINPK